ncbi:MAG: response regulator transcription factor [Balneolaceae bacterium]|nr:response regulator transcription factor [Balneolaceae bacterium]
MAKLEGLDILVIEDDPTVRLLVKKALEHHGGNIEVADTAESGSRRASNEDFDMIILDLRLPDGNGYDVCEGIRSNGIKTPVLILSAEQETDVKVKNLNAGADDYLTKPFSIDELLARIEAILRRSSSSEESELTCMQIRLDLIERQAYVSGSEVDLTNSEFNLLAYLIKNKGRIISQEELAKNVWGIGFNTQTNYINVYISYLRKKIRVHSDFSYIRTVRKKGFKIVCSETEEKT